MVAMSDELYQHILSCPLCRAIPYNYETGNRTVDPECEEGKRLQELIDEEE